MRLVRIGDKYINFDQVEMFEISEFNNDVFVWFWWSKRDDAGDCMVVRGRDALELREVIEKLSRGATL